MGCCHANWNAQKVHGISAKCSWTNPEKLAHHSRIRLNRMFEVLSGSNVAMISSRSLPKAAFICSTVYVLPLISTWKQHLTLNWTPLFATCLRILVQNLFKSLICEKSYQMCWIHPPEQRIRHLENDCRVLVKCLVTMSSARHTQGDMARSWLYQLQSTRCHFSYVG
jgi:hypothetical protein